MKAGNWGAVSNEFHYCCMPLQIHCALVHDMRLCLCTGSACLYLCSIILAAYYRLLGSGYDWQVPCTKSVQASHSSPTVYCLLFLQLLTWKDCSCSLRNIGSSAVKLYSLLEWLSQYGCGTHTDTTFCMCSACTCMYVFITCECITGRWWFCHGRMP